MSRKTVDSWQIVRHDGAMSAHIHGQTLSARTPAELWLKIADHSAGHYIHLSEAHQTVLPQVWPEALRLFAHYEADALLGRILYADGKRSHQITQIETCRYLNTPAGILCVTSAALAKAARAMPRHEWDEFWVFDLILHICATSLVRGTALTFAKADSPPPASSAARMPYLRASDAPQMGAEEPTILIYGRIEASVSLYFDGLPPELKARLRFLQPGTLVSDMGWLASASLVLVVRDFQHMAVTGALDLLNEIGVPYAWFIDDDLIALSGEVKGFDYYTRPAVEAFLQRATAIVVTSEKLASTYQKLHQTVIVWPCVYNANLASSNETLHIGIFGGAFRRGSFQSHVQPAINRLRGLRPVHVFAANDISEGNPGPRLRLMPFESAYGSFVLRWQRLGLRILVHPYGETVNIANKSLASILSAAYLGAVPVVGHEPAYALVSEENGVLKAQKDSASWHACLLRLADPAQADLLLTRLNDWCQAHFNPEKAREPFNRLMKAALPGTIHHQALRWQRACQSSTLGRIIRSSAATPPTKLEKLLKKLRRWWRHPFKRSKVE